MSCLRLIGRLIALFIILIFVVMTPALILTYDVQQVAVEGNFLDELFQETDLFEAAIPEIAENLEQEIEQDVDMRTMPIARLDAADWERIIHAIAPPEMMQQVAQEGLEGWRQWVRQGGRFLDDITIPFGQVRDNVVNDPEQTVLRTLTQALPACSGGQEPLGGLQNLIPQCRPRESQLETFYQRLGQRWQEQSREVWQQLWPADLARYPDNISLADLIEEESDEELPEIRTSWRTTRWGLRAARWFLAAFIAGQCAVAMGLVALFAARNWREVLRWVGTPLALAGLFTLLLAVLFLAGAEIGTWFISEEEIPIGAQEVIQDSARAFADELWPPMVWQGGVLVMVGLGMWVLSLFAPLEDEWPYEPVVTTAPPPASEPLAPVETVTDEPEESEAAAPPASEPLAPVETVTDEPEESEAAAPQASEPLAPAEPATDEPEESEAAAPQESPAAETDEGEIAAPPEPTANAGADKEPAGDTT